MTTEDMFSKNVWAVYNEETEQYISAPYPNGIYAYVDKKDADKVVAENPKLNLVTKMVILI